MQLDFVSIYWLKKQLDNYIWVETDFIHGKTIKSV